MNVQHPRYGRQIPEWMVLGVVFSLSGILGFPIAGRWRLAHPEANKLLLGVLGLLVGFVILVGIWAALAGLFVLFMKVREMIKSQVR